MHFGLGNCIVRSGRVLLTLASLAALDGAAHTAVTFTAPANYPTGSGATGVQFVALGDFNRDGKLDAVTANGGTNNVTVFMNQGGGVLAASASYSVGTTPVWIASKDAGGHPLDLNGDGYPDLVVANSGSNNVSLLLGTALGTFLPGGTVATGSQPISVAAGDLNGDGMPDLAVANKGSATLSILINDGSLIPGGIPTFHAAPNLVTGAGPDSVVIANLNTDSTLDIAAANATGRNVNVFVGLGSGAFSPQYAGSGGLGPYSIVSADFDGDGRVDLAVADYSKNSIDILKGAGDGNFGLPVSTASGDNPRSLAIGDFNSDGRPDAVLMDTGLNRDVAVMQNSGGTLSVVLRLIPNTSFGNVAVGDIDGDGQDDIVLSNATNSVTVLLNTTPFLADFTITPSSVHPNNFANATITLTRPAPPGGTDVALVSSDSAVAGPPPTVTILAGQTSVQFTVAARAIGTANITATVNEASKTATLNVTPDTSSGIPGDLNHDGVVDIADVALLARVVGGLDTLP